MRPGDDGRRVCRPRCSGRAAAASAPGAPCARTTWTSADKDGFGTAIGRGSKVWFTLSRGRLSEVFAPRLDPPSVRDLELLVSDGRTFTERESAATTLPSRASKARG
jgi:glucoamylase